MSARAIATHVSNDRVSNDNFGTSLQVLLNTSKNLPKEPVAMKEAFNGPRANEWKKAMDAKMATLTERGTWKLVELSKGHRPMGVKWVF